MTCWRIVFSTFCGCMSFYIGSVKSRPGAMSPPMSGLPESGQSGVLLDHLVGAGQDTLAARRGREPEKSLG